MGEARSTRDFDRQRLQAAAAVSAFEVWQAPSGAAGVYDPASATDAVASGAYFELTTAGEYSVKKASGVVFLKGQRVYWDHSAGQATYLRNNDKDFYVGRAHEDAASSAPTVLTGLNEDPRYDIELARDGFLSVLVGTAAAGGLSYPVNLGGALIFELTATNEAQKVDALSTDGFDLAANAIVEGCFRIISDGGAGAQDFSIGVASGTHASDFESVTSFVALHLDGDTTTINAESDDNATDVAPTNTTTTYSEGSAVANRVFFQLDFRDPADVQVYINGANVLPSSVFTAGTTGTHYLIVHLEKTATTDTYKAAVDFLRAYTAEQ